MTTQPAYLTLGAGTSRYLTMSAGTNYYLTLQDPAPYDNDVALLLAEATWYIDSHDHDGSETIVNMGTGGTALNALNGGGTAVSSNDAKWLAYDPADGAYAYLPGATSNGLSVPSLNVTGDIELIVRLALDSYTTGTQSIIYADGSDPNRRCYLNIESTGRLRFAWYPTGSAASSLNSLSSVAVPFNAGEAGWIKVTLDVDNGASGNDTKFFTSTDGVTFTQLGTTVTKVGTTSLPTVTRTWSVGTGSGAATGKFYRAIVKDGIDGTTVLDVDTSVLTSGDQTTFNEQSSNAATVTVNRSTSGRKTTLVGGWAGGGSLWLLGTDDYMEVPDNDAIDFGASDSFTVLLVTRRHTSAATAFYLTKWSNASTSANTAGWALFGSSNLNPNFRIADGATGATASTNTLPTAGALTTVFGVRDVAADTVAKGISSTLVSTTDTTTATLANATVMRIGAYGAGTSNTLDAEVVAACIWRRALTTTEIAGLNLYFQNRAYNG